MAPATRPASDPDPAARPASDPDPAVRSKEAAPAARHAEDALGETVLEGRDLHKSFGAVEAVRGLSLGIPAGQLYGLVGPDGAGKTTTIRMLTGLMSPDAGQARVLGRPAQGRGAAREAVGYMPQQYSLYGDLSVHENLRFFGRLFGLRRADFRKREKRLLHITRLTRFSHRRADALSGGMYKKLALACALLHRPRVLVLDEPTNGVDPVSRRELWDLLYEFVAEGMAVLLSTPYMDEAARCHRVGLIHQGRLLTEDAPGALAEQFAHRAYRVSGPDRRALELAVERRPEVMGLTPHGASLRLVVRGDAAEGFVAWVKQAEAVEAIDPVSPDFEDVFLALLAGSGEGEGEGEDPEGGGGREQDAGGDRQGGDGAAGGREQDAGGDRQGGEGAAGAAGGDRGDETGVDPDAGDDLRAGRTP